MRVLTLGHACIDITPRIDHSPGIAPGMLYPVGPLRFSLGGSTINTARKLRELGTDVRIATGSGNDDLGLIYSRLLEELGIPTELVSTDLGTSYSIVVEHGLHDRTFWQYEGFNGGLDARDVDLTDPALDLVHAGYPSLMPRWCADVESLRQAFSLARSHHITTSLDLAQVGDGSVASRVHWDEWFSQTLPFVDVLSPSWDDVTSALRIQGSISRQSITHLARRLLDYGVGIVQLSAGDQGFVLVTADEERLAQGGTVVAPLAASWAGQELWFEAESIKEPKTTVGAGDALTAGLLHALGEGFPPLEAGILAREVVGQHLRGRSEA